MSKKNVYFVQPVDLYGNNVYFPYASGIIASTTWDNEIIKKSYELKDFIFIKKKIKDVILEFDNPFLVGFSNYIWNFEYNKALAKEIKKVFPNVLIVFGGHNVRSGTVSLLEKEVYIDLLIYDEGEIPFRDLLLNLYENNGKITLSLLNVSNLAFRYNNDFYRTESKCYELDNLVSPYLSGCFDTLLKDNPNYNFTATLETNRGCPYGCAYCDWGNYPKNERKKLRRFSLERIKDEINWFGKNKIDFIMGADSNFGILERDVNITDFLISAKKKYNFPNKFRVSYAKYSTDRIYEISKKFNEYKMDKGITLSFQSMTPVVLENIGRKNMDINNFRGLMAKYNKEHINTYSELILGLPGETYDSFCDSISKLLENGQHSSINIYKCELLCNSRMGEQAFIDKFRIETQKTYAEQYHIIPAEKDMVKELSNIVVATHSMGRMDWVKANFYSVLVETFHILGIMQLFAIYLYYEKQVSYKDFYNNLYIYIYENKKSVLYEIFNKIYEKIYAIAFPREGEIPSWEYVDERFGKLTWPFEELAFLQLVYHLDETYQSLFKFLKEKYVIEEEIFNELFLFQKLSIAGLKKETFNVTFSWDFIDYFNNVYQNKKTVLQKNKKVYQVHFDQYQENWEKFAIQTVFYGRKGGKCISFDKFKKIGSK